MQELNAVNPRQELARAIALSPVLDDERKIAALQNLSEGLYTDTEAKVIAEYHITSTPLKLFFLSKSYKLIFSDSLSRQNRAAFVVVNEPPDLTEEIRLERARGFDRAEVATIVRAAFYFGLGGKYLKVMWIDPMLMHISLEEYAKEIDRNLYQTDRIERKSWMRINEKGVVHLEPSL